MRIREAVGLILIKSSACNRPTVASKLQADGDLTTSLAPLTLTYIYVLLLAAKTVTVSAATLASNATISEVTFPGDVDALRDLQQSFHTIISNWTGDPCQAKLTWVNCSQNTNPIRIVSITVYGSGNNTFQTLPSSIVNLTALNILRFSSTKVQAPLPDLSPLHNLQTLRINSCGLQGPIPSWISQMTNLTSLYLSHNELTGSIPTKLFQLTKLVNLYLDDNKFNGAIPDNVGDLQQLQQVKFSFNNLSGTIPKSLSELANLQYLFLDNNEFLEGPLPNLSTLTSLQKMYVHHCPNLNGIMPSISNLVNLDDLLLNSNKLSGSIPSMTNLPALNRLWLSGNDLTGDLPDLSGLTNITNLQLNNNNLSGAIPPSIANLQTLENLSLEDNNFTSLPQGLLDLQNSGSLHLTYDRYLRSSVSGQHETKRTKLIIAFVVPVAFGLSSCLLIAALCQIHRKRKIGKLKDVVQSLVHPICHPPREGLDMSMLVRLAQGPRKFSLQELVTATNNFDKNAVLGKGGFGFVYKGMLPGTGKGAEFAVKKISQTSKQGVREFMAEVKVIGQIRHKNLVQLLGWCYEEEELMLVYEFMPNGSLDKSLFQKQPFPPPVLTWKQRYEIICGVARALVFLHEEWEQRVVHRDVKAGNVMLDSSFNAHLGDFGLARLYEHADLTPQSTFMAGTWGYLAPECTPLFKSKVTDKTDVYSFGALALEVASGRKVIENDAPTMEYMLQDWVWALYRDDKILEAVDDRLSTCSEPGYDEGQMTTLLQLGLLCSNPDPAGRPHMRLVLSILSGDATVPEVPREKPVPIFASRPVTTLEDIFRASENLPDSLTARSMNSSTASVMNSKTSSVSVQSMASVQLSEVSPSPNTTSRTVSKELALVPNSHVNEFESLESSDSFEAR